MCGCGACWAWMLHSGWLQGAGVSRKRVVFFGRGVEGVCWGLGGWQSPGSCPGTGAPHGGCQQPLAADRTSHLKTGAMELCHINSNFNPVGAILVKVLQDQADAFKSTQSAPATGRQCGPASSQRTRSPFRNAPACACPARAWTRIRAAAALPSTTSGW